MLPPIDSAVLQNNPDFATLYKSLTTAVLNPNGSTKNDPAAKRREAVREQLTTHRLHNLKQTLLITALTVANPTDPTPKPSLRRPRSISRPEPTTTTLPPDLITLLTLLPPLLSPTTTLPPESTTLLLSNPPFTTLPTLLPLLASRVSSTLISRATLLSRLLNQSTNPSFLHRTIPSLPTQTITLTTVLSTKKQHLTSIRTETATTLTKLLTLQTQVLASLIRVLEGKHGNIARSLELRAAEVAMVAARQGDDAGRVRGLVRGEVYSPSAMRALEGYADHLRDARGRVGEDIRGLRDVLGSYGVRDGEGGDQGMERTMREMARVYREMNRQVEEVRGDLVRLGRA